MPRLSVDLVSLTTQVKGLEALIDSASSTNVLPRSVGDALGFGWYEAEHTILPKIRGVKALSETLGVAFQDFGIIELGFAWIQDDSIPLILGQLDFFEHFLVCFDASERTFSLELKSGLS